MLRIFFSFAGRIDRRAWWLASLGLVVVGVLLRVFGDVVAIWLFPFPLPTIGDPAAPLPFENAELFVQLVGFLIILWPWLAVGVKRCHDLNKSGWLMLVPVGLLASVQTLVIRFFLGPMSEAPGVDSDHLNQLATAWMVVAGGGATIFQIIVLGFLRGSPQSNRFGVAAGGGSLHGTSTA